LPHGRDPPSRVDANGWAGTKPLGRVWRDSMQTEDQREDSVCIGTLAFGKRAVVWFFFFFFCFVVFSRQRKSTLNSM